MKYFVLIVDCSGDGGVKSRILEEYQNLVEYGYKTIVGLRDAPKQRADIPRLQQGLPKGVPILPVPVVFVLAIMQIEAWFLAEHTHFSRIDERLTTAQAHEILNRATGRRRGAADRKQRSQVIDQVAAALLLEAWLAAAGPQLLPPPPEPIP